MNAFDYQLPKDRIAQWLAALSGERSDSKLLVLNRTGGSIADSQFSRIGDALKPGDLLILNDSAVVPSRFLFEAAGKQCELFLLNSKGEGVYEALARPLEYLRQSGRFSISPGLGAEVVPGETQGPRMLVQIRTASGELASDTEVRSAAGVPIPPYIRGGRSGEEDRELYQTVYARSPGSVAAPTAGLHFTPDLLGELSQNGVEIAYITLHVSTASFRAAAAQDPALEKAEAEEYFISSEIASKISSARARSARIFAVGTTTVRALESWHLEGEPEMERPAQAQLLIKPPFDFGVVTNLITNFHQPGSTHLLLVSALAGTELLRAGYEHALSGDYRFLSYGDSMVIL